jgi:serine phosphatase RsbU (regulator of sigma subunit)/anti-sigma regulatory factor (Ser/Thr protein kinase)
MVATPHLHSGTNIQLSLACDIEQVRPVARVAREFLAAKNLSEEELMACELTLVEACNNAVNYALPSRQLDPISVELHCNESEIEIRIHDHTAGFELPEKIILADDDSETGRGLFIMKSLMDNISYSGADGENTLTLKRFRSFKNIITAVLPLERMEDLKSKLAESEQIVNEMAEELSSCYESLSAIFRSGTELGKTDNLLNFSRSLCEDLLKITSADWFLLRIVPKRTTVLSVFASSAGGEHLLPLITNIARIGASAELKAGAYRKDILFGSENPLDPNDPIQSMQPTKVGLVHPFYFAETLIGTLTIGKKSNERPFTSAHVNVVHTLADFLAIQIVNARIYEEQLNHRLVTRELEIASEIQRALLPKKLPQLRGFGLAGYCQSARHVGGDFFDVVSINQHSALLIIADVMGKGVPAAMFAAILRSILRGSLELEDQPAALLSRVNGLLHDELSEVDMFITAQLAFVDVQAREVIVASAGHCPALIFSGDNPEPKLISPEGMPLGILRETLFTEITEKLSHDCRLILYTDGVTESRNPNEQFFGHQRLVQWMGKRGSELDTAEKLKESLAAELNNFQEQAAPGDDQTFLILAEETF